MPENYHHAFRGINTNYEEILGYFERNNLQRIKICNAGIAVFGDKKVNFHWHGVEFVGRWNNFQFIVESPDGLILCSRLMR